MLIINSWVVINLTDCGKSPWSKRLPALPSTAKWMHTTLLRPAINHCSSLKKKTHLHFGTDAARTDGNHQEKKSQGTHLPAIFHQEAVGKKVAAFHLNVSCEGKPTQVLLDSHTFNNGFQLQVCVLLRRLAPCPYRVEDWICSPHKTNTRRFFSSVTLSQACLWNAL